MTAATAPISLAELDTDPYPVYARLRQTAPVSWIPELGQWLVTGWADVERVLGDSAVFTTEAPDSPMIGLCGGVPMLLREGEAHQDIRAALLHGQLQDRDRVVACVEAATRPHAERAAASLRCAGRAELTAGYFEPVACRAVAALLGTDPPGSCTLGRWGQALALVAANFTGDAGVAAAAADALSDDTGVASAVARTRTRPDDTVISHLVHANRVVGDERPDGDVLPVLKHVAMSVVEAGWLGAWTLRALLDHPDQHDAVRADRRLLDAAVTEALRWGAPVGTLTRRVLRPVTLAGQHLPAGATLVVAIASANRDETQFTDPDAYDLHRPARAHLGFGIGPHHCPAAWVAPAIARTALDVLFDQLPGLRPGSPTAQGPHGWKLRLPGAVNAAWDSR